jgi:hypothetical protein
MNLSRRQRRIEAIAGEPKMLRLSLSVLLVSCLFTNAAAIAAEPIPADDFAELHSLIRPSVEESVWLSIPWRTDLWQARLVAAAEGKPILLWEMDGHPLGCT